MANISGFLQNILSARFGKDVRQSIHDAIEEIDKVADTAKDSATAMAKTATEKASEASGYASSAKTSEENAKSYMKSAKTSENNSKTSETNAKTSETNAKASEINAKVSEENAQAVFESLPEDYSTLSNEFYEVAIKQTASGEDIHVTDSANAKVREFALFGKATQETTSGKNLLDFETITWNINNNATFSKDNNILTIKTNGEIHSGIYSKVLTDDLIGKTITVSADITISDGARVLFGFEQSLETVPITSNKKTRLTQTLILSSDKALIIYSGEDIEKTITVENMQIEIGSVATEYEPYTGGQPSPSPDYPQEIEVPSGDVVVKSCGKNKLDPSKNTIGFIQTDGTYVDLQGYLTSDFIKTNGKTAISANSYVGDPYIRVYFYDLKKNFIKRELLNLTPTTLSKIVENIGYIRVCYDNAENMSVENVQIEEGDVATPYQPYKETTSTIPVTDFAGIPVSSGGNYTDSNGQQWICDEIVKYADESGERVQRIKKKQITSDLTFATWPTKGRNYSRYMSLTLDLKKDDLANILCSHLTKISATEAYREEKTLGIFPDGSSSATNAYIGFINPDWTTLDEFKAFLDANEVYAYYELATPIRTPLTVEEIAEIEKLSTFYPVTNISNDADCGMSVTYLADSKLYIDNRLAQIEAALVNNI